MRIGWMLKGCSPRYTPAVVPLFFAAFLILLSAGCRTAAAPDSLLAITNVNVVPMTSDTVLANYTVLIRNGSIAHVAPEVTIPPEARRIDGGGRYLIPGLADMHIHLRSTAELRTYLAHGVTTVVHMSGAMSGAPDLLRYRQEIAAGERIGPTLYATGPILDGDPPIFGGVSRAVASPDEARRAVAEQHEAGYDLIKVYNNLEPEALRAVVDEAHQRGMAVVGHIPRAGGRSEALQRALAAGIDMIAHGEEYFFTFAYPGVDSLLDRGEVPYRSAPAVEEAAHLTSEAGAAVTPNLSFVQMTRRQLEDFDAVLDNPEAQYLDADVREMWMESNPTQRSDVDRFDLREQAKYRYVRELTASLQDAGVTLLLGTDASASGMYPGASAHLELRELVGAGLSPYEALATGTVNAGRFMADHVAGTRPFGRIAEGHRADLLLVRGNPLQDVRAASEIDAVIVGGRFYSREDLERRREDRAPRP